MLLQKAVEESLGLVFFPALFMWDLVFLVGLLEHDGLFPLCSPGGFTGEFQGPLASPKENHET